jgi:hypothetical protein
MNKVPDRIVIRVRLTGATVDVYGEPAVTPTCAALFIHALNILVSGDVADIEGAPNGSN